jgi:hypothetical protein
MIWKQVRNWALKGFVAGLWGWSIDGRAVVLHH